MCCFCVVQLTDVDRRIKFFQPVTKLPQVTRLHSLVATLRAKGLVQQNVSCILDKDSDTDIQGTPEVFRRDVYHIENYLLEPTFILKTLNNSLGKQNQLDSETKVLEALRECASSTLDDIVYAQLEDSVYRNLKKEISIHVDRNSSNFADSLSNAIAESLERMDKVSKTLLNSASLKKSEDQIRADLGNDLSSDAWRISFKGRNILSRFAKKYCQNMKYEIFRNLIVSTMRDNNYRPEGMHRILKRIVEV